MTKYSITQIAKEEKFSIYPLFLPFFGCPQICTFCNQSLQTATQISKSLLSSKQSLLSKLESLRKELELSSKNSHKKNEIAFYGGTFSALPDDVFILCLEFVKDAKAKGYIKKARCSTRPDACSSQRLSLMKSYGIDTIELGIQTFEEKALLATNRAYSPQIAIESCKKIKEEGFALGIQLLPNIPKQSKEDFLKDIAQAISLKPDFMRFYPCLVVEDTLLAKQWKNNEHEVWDLESMLDLLARALFQTWQAKIPVIRIGVAYEKDFYAKILAGVHHPHLGQLVQEKALQILIEKLAKQEHISPDSKELQWHFPLSCKGFLSLKKNKDFLSSFHISAKNIVWHNSDTVFVTN